MADRTSAEIYGTIFRALASDKPVNKKALARKFWAESFGYDFSPYQMDCDEELVKLGLAKTVDHPDYDDGVTVYRNARGTRWCTDFL